MTEKSTDSADRTDRTSAARRASTGSTHRRGFVALASAAAATSLAGCTAGVLGREDSSDHDRRLRVELAGDGPYDPVDLRLEGNTVDVELTAEPGDDLDAEDGDFEETVEGSIEHDDEVVLEVEWDVDDVTVHLELDQELWSHTTVDLGFTVADGTVAFDADLDLELIESTTELTLSDERPDDEWTFDIDVAVDDLEDVDVDFETDRREDDNGGGPPWA